ncbi:MAG: TRL domain-containing protein [Bacteroidota bacterium]
MKKLIYWMLFASTVLLGSCSITQPVAATSNPIGSKVGKASGTCYFYQLCLGADASIQKAAKNGGIN